MLRRSLVQDAFEYMQLPESAVSADLSQAEELAALVVRAAQEEADSIEVQLSQCQVSWSKAAEDPDVFHVLFDKLELPISLELASSSASTTTGSVPLTIELGEGQTWEAGCPLRLRGSLPGAGAAVTTVRLVWARSTSVVFLGTCGQPCDSCDLISDAGRHSGFPAFNLADGTSSARESKEGARKPSDLRLKLEAETVLPVEPVAGLVSECFFFYVVIYAWPERASTESCQIGLACHARFSEDLDDSTPAHLAEKPTGLRVELLKASGADKPFDLEPLALGTSRVVAGFSASEFKASENLLGLLPADLEGAPLRLHQKGSSQGAAYFALPLAVRCEHACGVSLGLEVQQIGGDAAAQCWTPQIKFKHAVKLHTAEERLSAAMLAQKPVSFSLRCHLATAVETVKAEIFYTPEGSDTERTVACLGKMGQMQPGSSYAFLWPVEPGLVLKSRPRLRVCFQRYQAAQAFFPWKDIKSTWPPNPMPAAVVEWLLPVPTAAAVSSQSLQVELQASSTGTVGTPLAVQVRLRYARSVDHDEIKIRVLQGEGEVPDRYLLSGPTCYQAACLPATDPNDVIPGFALIPLKTGWLSLPRVQVTWGSQDATSTPTSVFITPARQLALVRSLT